MTEMVQEKLNGESKEESNEEKTEEENNYRVLTHCPYCKGKLIKKGKRKKKFENIQLYFCKNCNKKITPLITKNKTYPLKIIIDSLTLHNRLNTLEGSSKKIEEKYGIKITPQIISRWIREYEKFTPFSRMRDFILKNYSQKEIIEESKMIHQQIYDFKYHRAKLDLILNEEFRHYKFKPLQEFLELITAECPHQLFTDTSNRASDFKNKFNLEQVKIVPKTNTAVKIANFVIQSIANNKLRHEVLQDFMLANDTATVAIEVPIIIDAEDIRHYKHELNFDIPITLSDGEYITGHVDLIQVRNGSIYIMDFKPSAKKDKPIEQLIIYALALSRLTGLKLYNFKCAWFDEQDYFEFFPLHVVYKLKKRKRKLPREQKKLGSG